MYILYYIEKDNFHKYLIFSVVFHITNDFCLKHFRMKILGIEFAPLDIPMQRRLQTLAVVHYTYIFLFMGFGLLFFFLYLLFTDYYYIPLLYALWYYYDRHTSERGGRRSQWVREWPLFKYFAEYFPISLIKTADLSPAKNYIFGLHPHGIMCHSHFCNMGSEGTGFSLKFPAIRPYLCVLSGQFMFPVFREYFLLSGTRCETILFSFLYWY